MDCERNYSLVDGENTAHAWLAALPMPGGYDLVALFYMDGSSREDARKMEKTWANHVNCMQKLSG